MNELKYCPFRTKDGEFAECYGEKCMAYYEYEVLQATKETRNSFSGKYVNVPGCKLIGECET